MKLFNLDSPIMRALSRMADLLLLNTLALICCIPIVTAGASFTAMHYVSLKLARKEEPYIARSFFKSFKENFKQATIIWLLCLLVLVIFAGDIYIMMAVQNLNVVLRGIIIITMLVAALTMTMLFPVLAKFDNTVWATIKNSLLISIMQFPKTVIMFVLNWVPWILMLSVIEIFPLCILFGLALPAYLSAYLYNKLFQKLEDRIMEAKGDTSAEALEEDERIFHDELDASILNNNNIS